MNTIFDDCKQCDTADEKALLETISI